jgi:hypothetical protein
MSVDHCFECGKPSTNIHHVVPVLRGGKRTVPLCKDCHNLVHDVLCRQSVLDREAFRLKRERGEWWGHPPFGYTVDDGQLVPLELEQKVLKRISELKEQKLSGMGVYRQLCAEGFLNRTGKPLSESTIRRIVRNPPMESKPRQPGPSYREERQKRRQKQRLFQPDLACVAEMEVLLGSLKPTASRKRVVMWFVEKYLEDLKPGASCEIFSALNKV